jgi:hypothetical protein
MIVLLISYNLWPAPSESLERNGQLRSKSQLISFIYLASFAAHFGAQMWMTFVSGLALYFSLPRHTFGMCQEVLFPKYFFINTLLSITTLITFTKIDTKFNDARWIVQLATLTLCLVLEMLIYFYLTPPLLKLMRAKYQFEQKLGNGQEIGYHKMLASFKCPQYKSIHNQFRKLHFKCAMGNVIAICCTFIHLHYLASKITIM